MVDNPDQVQVREQQGEGTAVLVLSVAKQDIGIIIGKKGWNINDIRTIMGAAAAKLHKRDIVELRNDLGFSHVTENIRSFIWPFSG